MEFFFRIFWYGAMLLLGVCQVEGVVKFNFVYEEELARYNDPKLIEGVEYFKSSLEKGKPNFKDIERVKKEIEEGGKVLGSYLKHDGEVDILILFLLSDENATLGRSMPDYPDEEDIPSQYRPLFYGSVVGEKIQTGIDYSDKEPHGTILIYQGIEDEDIRAIIIHELIHTLGYDGFLGTDSDHVACPGFGRFSKYDYYVVNSSGQPLWLKRLANDTALSEQGYFVGPKTMEAFWGIPLPLPKHSNWPGVCDYYHPSSDGQGCLLAANIMHSTTAIAAIDKFEPLKLSPVEVAILEDIGYEINKELALTSDNLLSSSLYCPNLKEFALSLDIRSIFLEVAKAQAPELADVLKRFDEEISEE